MHNQVHFPTSRVKNMISLHDPCIQSKILHTSASKLSNTSPSHGVRDWLFAPLSESIASPKSRSGLLNLRSLYFATTFKLECGVEVVAKPKRSEVAPLSIMRGVRL